jgi:hypothetical protein
VQRRKNCYFVVLRLWFGNGNFLEGIVDFSGLAVDFLYRNGRGHGCRELGAQSKLCQGRKDVSQDLRVEIQYLEGFAL